MSCLPLSRGYGAVLLLSSLEELVLLARVVTAVLPDVQNKRGSSCFTLSLLPIAGFLYQGRATQKLMGTQGQGCHEETANGVSAAHGGGGYSACTPRWLESPWTRPADICLIHSAQEMEARETKAGCFRTLSDVTSKDMPSAAGETNRSVLT